MLNVLNGVYRPHKGIITFNGRSKERWTPRKVAKQGVGRTFQNIALFKGMTALENIQTGRCLMNRASFLNQAFRLPKSRREDIQSREKAEELLEFLEIQAVRKTSVGQLSYGLQKRIELGRALAAEPKLLFLDEPMAGMSLEEKQDMTRFILQAKDAYKMTVILIEHDLGVVMDISDHVIVLDYGKKIADGTPDQVKKDHRVIDAYVGRNTDI
jgi:branched-chain amino acid transport system ATP-binding protein